MFRVPRSAFLLPLVGLAALLLLGDADSRWLTLNSLGLAGGAAVVSVSLGTALALLATRTNVPGGRVANWLMMAMLFVPLYLQAAGWDAMYGRQGWYTLLDTGLQRPLPRWTAAIWIHAMAAVPWVYWIVVTGLRFIERQWEEQALLDAPAPRVIWHVTLRHVLAGVGVALLWVVVWTAGEMTVTDMYQVRTYAEQLFLEFARRDTVGDVTLTLAPGLLGLATLVAATVAVLAWVAPAVDTESDEPPRFSAGRLRWPLALLMAMILLVVVAAPLANVVYKAGAEVTVLPDGGRERVWSAAKVAEVLADSPWRFRRDHGWTLAIGFWSATAAVVLAAPLAWSARRSNWLALPALLLTCCLFALPGPLLGMLILQMRGTSDLTVWLWDKSLFAPVLALSLRALPLATLVLWFAMRSVSKTSLESAALEGAGPLARFAWIAAPQRLPAFGLAWLVAFVIASGDLATTILVVPPGVVTVSIRVFDFLHSGVDDQVAGLCLTSVAGYLVLALAATQCIRRWRRSA